MTVETIIVNYNAGDTLLRCVTAVLKSQVPTRVTIVDNASVDGSAETVRSFFGNRREVQILLNEKNLGFAPAVNLAARRSDAEWILVLNPDCIVEPDTIGRLQHALESDGQAALAGPAVLDENGSIQRATVRRFPDPWKSLMTATGLWRLGRWFPAFHGVEVDVTELDGAANISEAVSGACMLIRRSALETLGFMDEEYAMHCEDLDLMYRIRDHGWRCLYVPQARCTHEQGLSSRSRPTWVHFQKHRGMARFYRKFQAKSTFVPLRVLVYAGIWLRFFILWPLVLVRR